MDVAAGRATGRPLVADAAVPPSPRRPLLHDDLAEVGVDAAIAVAVIDDDDDREGRPELLLLEPVRSTDRGPRSSPCACRSARPAARTMPSWAATTRSPQNVARSMPSWNGSPSTMREPHGDGPNGSVRRPLRQRPAVAAQGATAVAARPRPPACRSRVRSRPTGSARGVVATGADASAAAGDGRPAAPWTSPTGMIGGGAIEAATARTPAAREPAIATAVNRRIQRRSAARPERAVAQRPGQGIERAARTDIGSGGAPRTPVTVRRR